jgi:hypothetical protein
VVVHGHHIAGTICSTGETIERCYLQFPEREVAIPFALPGLMLCDCMVRHRDTPLSIARIEGILTSSPFYRRLGAHSFERTEVPHFTRASLRVYIARLREKIGCSLRIGGSTLPGDKALISETTESNVVAHRIALPVRIVHQASTASR